MYLLDRIRTVSHRVKSNSLRELYWTHSKTAEIKRQADQNFSKYIGSEYNHLRENLSHIGIANEVHLQAAVAWLLEAQKASPDDGVSLGFFPYKPGKWQVSYPETTGYIITTLIGFGQKYNQTRTIDAALKMARWEIDVQMPSGAVQGGPLAPSEKQTAAAFNTGMVLDGWCSAYEHTADQTVLDAAMRAGHFLRDDVGPDGFFQTNGAYVKDGNKTYTCLVCWAMLRLAKISGDDSIAKAAIQALENAVSQQNPIGWFENNCLTDPVAPLTHTIGYALQGVFESGLLLDREDFVQAAALGTSNVLRTVARDGWLSGRLNDKWRACADWCCLTGSCQIAIVAYRLAAERGLTELIEPADRLVNYVKATQRLQFNETGYQGGIAGSFPVLGAYMQGGFPNWATKYFVDALMLQDEAAR